MDPETDHIDHEDGFPVNPDDPGQDGGPGSPKGKARRLLGSTPVLTVFLLALLAAISMLAWRASLWKQDVAVSKIVVAGTRILQKQRLESSLSRFSGRKLTDVREDEIRRVLLAEPYIRSATISRELNGIVRVTVDERQPLAVTVFLGRPMVIDTEGMLLPDNQVSARFHRLPQVYGISAAVPVRPEVWKMPAGDARLLSELVTAFSQSDYAGLLLREIHLAPGNQSWFLATGSPIRFIVGNDGNFKEKLKKFEIFWQKVIAKKGLDCYESVDLRFRERVFAKGPDIAGPSQAPSVPAPAAPTPLPASQFQPHEPH